MKSPVALVTIVAESLLREEIVKLIRRHGATGFTLTKVEGEGSRGVRASDWEGRNVKIETLVPFPAAEAIVEAVAEEYFEDYAVIAWLCEVGVMRGAKFSGEQ